MKQKLVIDKSAELIRKTLLVVNTTRTKCETAHKSFSGRTSLFDKRIGNLEKSYKEMGVMPEGWRLNTVSDAFFAINSVSEYAREYSEDYTWFKKWGNTVNKIDRPRKSKKSSAAKDGISGSPVGESSQARKTED